MTDPSLPPPPAPPMSPKEAQAQAKAAKAHAKALRPWYKKKRYIIGLGILAVIIISAIASGGSKDKKTTGASGSPATASTNGDALPALGSVVADGKFHFTVSAFTCGATTVGPDVLHITAKGVFCVADMSIENTSKESHTYFATDQKLVDSQGRKYDGDLTASFWAANPNTDQSGQASSFENVGPGFTLATKVVFDVPAGAVPVSLELHDSAFSDGVKAGVS